MGNVQIFVNFMTFLHTRWRLHNYAHTEFYIFKEKISELFNLAHKNNCIHYNTLHFLSNSEAEMVKMFRNCFLATKVSFCNEIYEFCEKI